ncbi:MAG: SDR family oxidoreductase [Armatimonas sp.]
MNSVLVTGGAGFIGSHLTRALLAQGTHVRVLDNLATGHRHNLASIWKDIEFVEGDLRELADCQLACRGVDAVFHLGALGSVPRSIDDPATSNAVNVIGTLNMLMAAREAGVRRLVFSSSSSVYGDTPTLPKHEGMRLNPRSPYAVTKMAGEEYCRAFFQTYGLEAVAIRYFNVFGPRQDPESAYAAVIPRFMKALLENRPITIFGDGEQSRDFTYVDNVVHANILAASAPDAGGRVMNVACGQQFTVNELGAKISALMGVPFAPEYKPTRAGDVQHSRADIAQAQEVLGYQPKVLFDEGLKYTVEAFLAAERQPTK